MNIDERRRLMVEHQLISRGIKGERLLNVFYKVPRHKFVSENLIEEAYGDYPLPIGEGQTISQPYMVAIMTQSLELTGNEKVLEVGTGSGYQAAILAELADEVYTVERIGSLTELAKVRLKEFGYNNIYFRTGNGTLGWEELAPYDRIIVTAACPHIPQSLLSQLGEDGRMVVPIGGSFSQMLTLIEKKGRKIKIIDVTPCIFVPLIGEEGFNPEGWHCLILLNLLQLCWLCCPFQS